MFPRVSQIPLTLEPDSENAKAMMRQFHVGTLDQDARKRLGASAGEDELLASRSEFLHPKHWAKATLGNVKTLSHDTKLFRFIFDEHQTVGLPIGQHLMLRIKDPMTNDNIIRAYTPVSEGSQKGSVDLLIKLYLPTPALAGGKMTTALDKIEIGMEVEFKGPIGKLEYLGRGEVTISGVRRKVSSFVMICGGSGVTPIFQVFRAVMQDSEDTTFCTVLDGNRQEEDILCREELDGLSALKRDGCRVIYTLTSPSADWTGQRGRISESLLLAEASPAEDRIALICGPGAMESFVRETLKKIGWSEDDIVFF